MAARNDPGHYGELIVYELPKQELVFGPLQVEGRIDQEPEISQQFSLWDQRGSRVIRGNLLVIPMGSSFLYVEPLYLLAETSELPELKRVIVASGDRIAMRETLGEALAALLELDPQQVEAIEEGERSVAGSLRKGRYLSRLAEKIGPFRRYVLNQARKRVAIRFVPNRVASWDHRKLGGKY